MTTLLLCLSLNIYHEARGESTRTQEAVAAITMNRTKAKDKPRTVCEVVYEPRAFSWTNHHKKVNDKEAFLKAKSIARLYLAGRVNKLIGNRIYFNEKRLGKRYKTANRPIVLGGFIMY